MNNNPRDLLSAVCVFNVAVRNHKKTKPDWPKQREHQISDRARQTCNRCTRHRSQSKSSSNDVSQCPITIHLNNQFIHLFYIRQITTQIETHDKKIADRQRKTETIS